MRKAIINVHGNPTLSRIVQELAFKAGFSWNGAKEVRWLEVKDESLSFGVTRWNEPTIFRADRHTTHQRIARDGRSAHGGNVLDLDAATEFDKVIAFFEQPQRPVIKVGEHPVEWSDDNKTIKVGCTVVPAETVKAIHDELFKK